MATAMAQSFEQLIVEPPGVSSDKAHCDLDAAWVNIDSDEADSTSSEWDSPRLSAPETVQAPSKGDLLVTTPPDVPETCLLIRCRYQCRSLLS